MSRIIIAFSGCAALLLGLTLSVLAADKEAKCKCPVSGKPADTAHAVDYKGAEVYFCCPNCPKAFTSNTEKFAAKANQQLVITSQAKQVKCPIAGRKLNPDTAIVVGGAQVAFCCNNCKKKATSAEGDEQVDLLFGDKAFEKGFEVKKEEGGAS